MAENINDILFPTKTYTLQPGEEVDTGFNNYGMYLVRSTSIGRTDLVFIGSSAIGQYTASGNESGFTSDVSSNSGIFVGRKENNGNIFIKNNATASRNVQIKRFRII